MKIPASNAEREAFYADIIIRCFSSRSDRIAIYDILKNYYLFGNQLGTQGVVDYNKLYSHIDLLASFLFSGETTTFVLEADEDADTIEAVEMEKAKILTPALNKKWHRSNLDLKFNEALVWSLVFSTTFLKFSRRPNGVLDPYVVEPHAMGVLLEHEPMLDRQPAIVHEFYMTKSDFEGRICHLPPEEQERARASAAFSERTVQSTMMPAPVTNLIVAAVKPEIKGNLQMPILANYDFSPRIMEECCTCQEVTVWDDDLMDYRVALMIEGSYLLFDHDCNPFIKGEHQFVKICPNELYNYFWGRSEMMYLIPLQELINTRVDEIKALLSRQANPPAQGNNTTGLTGEKYRAWMTPGGFWNNTDPTSKIQIETPKIEGDLFASLTIYENMFADVSGIRELMQGKGESGVRAKSHADLLVRVGSSRVKKKAAVLEDAVEKVGQLMFKAMQKDDATHYKTSNGQMTFVAGQLSKDVMVKVDSHSSSPIFVEQQMDKAGILFKAGAIDREDLIDAVKPQNSGYIKKKLKEREKAQALAAVAEKKKKEQESKNG